MEEMLTLICLSALVILDISISVCVFCVCVCTRVHTEIKQFLAKDDCDQGENLHCPALKSPTQPIIEAMNDKE